MLEEWLAWPVLGVALFIYCLMTLTIRVMEPQGLSARLGLATSDSGDEDDHFSPAEYKSTRIVVTTVRTASVIAIVMAALEGSRSLFATNADLLLMIAVAASVLIGVIVLRTLLNRLADGCYEDVEIWLSPIIWSAALASRVLRLNRVAEYMHEADNGSETHDEAEESVLNVLQNIASNDLRASDLMVPLSEVVAVDEDTSLEEIADMMVKFDLENILIYGEKIDDVLGTISKTTVLQALVRGDGKKSATDPSFRSAVFGAPVSQQVASLFDDFRGRSNQTAVMLDEEGLVAGVLTYDLMLRRLFINGNTEGSSQSDNEND